jgi:hypothetical protein
MASRAFLPTKEFEMTIVASGAGIDPHRSPGKCALPETVQLNAATLRTWRDAGYRLVEVRLRNWLYLQARGTEESAVYKITGPRFDGSTAVYDGWRVA